MEALLLRWIGKETFTQLSLDYQNLRHLRKVAVHILLFFVVIPFALIMNWGRGDAHVIVR